MRVQQRPVSFSLMRLILCVLLLGGVAATGWVAGQPPADKPKPKASGKTPQKKVDEQEDEDVKVNRVDEDSVRAKGPQSQPADMPEIDLKLAAPRVRHPAVRKMFLELAVPHDVVVFKAFERAGRPERELWVEPISDYLGTEEFLRNFRGDLTVQPIGEPGKPKGAPEKPTPEKPTLTSIKTIRHYERLVLDQVQEVLDSHFEKNDPGDSSKYLSRRDQFLRAEQALAAAVRFHKSAHDRGQRKGDAWEALEADLHRELLKVQIAQLNELADERDWDQAFALTRRLAATYTNVADQNQIARPLTDVLARALSKEALTDDQMRDARKRLRQLVEQYPDSKIIAPIAQSLQEQARLLFAEAKRLGKDETTRERVTQLLQMAVETWPELDGLRAYVIEMNVEHPILRVAVRELPVNLSPAKAATDAELRAVELLFEGLVKACPDDQGVIRYRQGLAVGRPRVVPLGREFQLPRSARWSNGDLLTASDVRFSVSKLGGGGGGVDRRPSAWTEVLDDKVEVHDPYTLTIQLKQGFLDPLALMTFKVLPEKQPVDSPAFAKAPVGSGPFVYKGRFSEQGREYALFTANPNYGSRQGKFGLPRIQEIRFYKAATPAKDLLSNEPAHQVDLALDLTADEAAALRKSATVQMPALGRAGVVNRRVYFLAVNKERLALQNMDVRRAIGWSINREKLLTDCFRGPLGKEVHQVLNGPFPANSWACSKSPTVKNPEGGLDLCDDELAHALMRRPETKRALGQVKLTLKFPSGDPAVAKAMTQLCQQVKDTSGIELTPVPVEPQTLRSDVEEIQSYDLAYYHYDFPDETFWLWPLLGLGNQLGLATPTEVETNLRESMGRRDFPQVQKFTHQVHEKVVSEMPLIPLWQLDALLAWGKQVKPGLVDPLLVFTDIDLWQLELAR
jgi:ABC-type transport system substrate-binding protein